MHLLFIQLDLSGILWMIWNLLFAILLGAPGLVFLLVSGIVSRQRQSAWRDTRGFMIGKPLLIAGSINLLMLGFSILLEHEKSLMKALDASASLLAIMEIILVVFWIVVLFRRKRIRDLG